MNVKLLKRDYSTPVRWPFHIQVKRYTWDVMGGPDEADCVMEFGGTNRSLIWTAIELIRCGVEIYDDRGACVWWGIIHSVTVNDGARSYGISLDNMFNRAKATYELIIAGESSGVRGDTPWEANLRSIALFGAREKAYSIITTSIAAALADAATRIEQAAWPVAIADLAPRGDAGYSVELLCRGYWDLMDWIYYDNADVTYSTIAEQLTAMVDYSDQMGYVRTKMAATVLAPDFRKGDLKIKDEVEQLMAIGTDNSRRILATVDRGRNVTFYEEPSDSTNYYLNTSNRLYNANVEVAPTECKVGIWANLKDYVNIQYQAETIIKQTPIFIERATYDVETGEYQPEQLGYKSPFEEMQSIQR